MPEWKSEPTKRECDYHTEYYYRKHKANITYRVLDYGQYIFYRFTWGQYPYEVVYDKPLNKWTLMGGKMGGHWLANEQVYGVPARIEEIEFINSMRSDGHDKEEYFYSGSGSPSTPWGRFRRHLTDNYQPFLYIFQPGWKRPISSYDYMRMNSYTMVTIPKPKSKFKQWITKWAVKILKKIHKDEKAKTSLKISDK